MDIIHGMNDRPVRAGFRSAGRGAEVKIEGLRPVSNEVIFVDMKPEENAEYEPLLGCVILAPAPAAVDMLGCRLVPVKYIDMK